MIFLKKPLIILTGPTAVGKTKLSISLAKAVNGAIISADSMQVYRHMDIGSAKIRPEEMCGVPHYLIDVLDPSEEFHVVKFVELAHEAMEKIYAAGQIPIVTGGTGFYIQALFKKKLILRNRTVNCRSGNSWKKKQQRRKARQNCTGNFPRLILLPRRRFTRIM